jgi:hypothetical protein
MAKTTRRRQASRVEKAQERPEASAATPTGIRRGTYAEGIALILDQDTAISGGGASVGCLGAPQYGKTTLLVRVLAEMRARGICDLTLIHDVKRAGAPQYDGVACVSAEEYARQAERFGDAETVVFNSPDWLCAPTLQEVCEVAAAGKLEGYRPAVVADEVLKGTDEFRNWLRYQVEWSPQPQAWFPKFQREGTSQGISTLWTTQIPQELPTTCRVLTAAVALFHLEGLSADAAEETFRLGAEGRDVLENLKRGEFVVYCQNRRWNRTIFGPG